MAKQFKSYRQESKDNWGVWMEPEEKFSSEQLRTGAILRIADSMEKLAQKYSDLEKERDRYKEWYNSRVADVTRLEKQNAGLRGHITRLKKAQQKP